LTATSKPFSRSTCAAPCSPSKSRAAAGLPVAWNYAAPTIAALSYSWPPLHTV
jgi:hypothetical protein